MHKNVTSFIIFTHAIIHHYRHELAPLAGAPAYLRGLSEEFEPSLEPMARARARAGELELARGVIRPMFCCRDSSSRSKLAKSCRERTASSRVPVSQ